MSVHAMAEHGFVKATSARRCANVVRWVSLTQPALNLDERDLPVASLYHIDLIERVAHLREHRKGGCCQGSYWGRGIEDDCRTAYSSPHDVIVDGFRYVLGDADETLPLDEPFLLAQPAAAVSVPQLEQVDRTCFDML